MEKQLILVTDFEKVEPDDYYISKDNKNEPKEILKNARYLAKAGKLYVAYIVPAVNYAIYYQMDADSAYIDEDMNVILYAESAIIGNDHEKRIEYEF